MTETNTTNTERLSLSQVFSNGDSANLANSLGGLQANPEDKYTLDQYDAFRHAYGSARYSEELTPQVAEFLGWAKETFSDKAPTDPAELKLFPDEQYMDHYNNKIGRLEYQRWKEAYDAGETEDSLEKWIYDRVKEGATINSLDDPRIKNKPVSFLDKIIDAVNNLFTSARDWTPPRRDPLTLDLDGDGIETAAQTGWDGVLFDQINGVRVD